MRRLITTLLTLALVAAALTAQLASAGSTGEQRAAGREALARRLLDPPRGLPATDPGLRADGVRGRRLVQPVVRLLGRADPGGQGGPRRRRRRPLARPGRRRARQGEHRRADVEPAGAPRDGHELARRLRRPRREPQEDLQLARPRPARDRGRDAESVHLRRRPLERDGGLRRAAQAREDRQAGAGIPAPALPARGRAGQERPRLAPDLQRGSRRRPPRLRERGDLREGPVHDPALDDPDREPGRGHEDERAQDRGERLPRATSARPARSRSSPRTATGRSSSPCSSGTASASPSGRASSTIDELGLGGWAKVQPRFFDPTNGIMARIERQVGGGTG